MLVSFIETHKITYKGKRLGLAYSLEVAAQDWAVRLCWEGNEGEHLVEELLISGLGNKSEKG